MQIRPHSELTRDEAIMLWQAERAENEMLRAENAEQARLLGISAERELALTAQLNEARKIIQRREAVIAILERDIHQLELQMEAIGAGGVGGKRITDDGALEALQACEQAYHRMIVDGTPQDCRAHDAARVAFWRVFGGGKS